MTGALKMSAAAQRLSLTACLHSAGTRGTSASAGVHGATTAPGRSFWSHKSHEDEHRPCEGRVSIWVGKNMVREAWDQPLDPVGLQADICLLLVVLLIFFSIPKV